MNNIVFVVTANGNFLNRFISVKTTIFVLEVENLSLQLPSHHFSALSPLWKLRQL